MNNCQYCGLWNCEPKSPICEEQREGKPSSHPSRRFKVGDFVLHEVHGKGQVVWVKPTDNGVRVHFGYPEFCDWIDCGDLTTDPSPHPANDSAGKPIYVGSKLMYPMSKGGAGNGAQIRSGTVEKIGEPTHRGFGYYSRKLSIRDDVTRKVVTHNYPANCVRIL